MSSSTVISFDIGIKNLAYCILQKDPATTQIRDWNVINLMTMPTSIDTDHTIDVVKCNCMIHKKGGKGTGKGTGKGSTSTVSPRNLSTSTLRSVVSLVCGKPAKFRKGEHTYCGVHAKVVVSAGTWSMPKAAYARSKLNARKKPELEVLATEVGCTLIPGNKSTYVDQLETWFRGRCLEPVQEPGHVAAKDMDLITLGRHMCAHLDKIFGRTRTNAPRSPEFNTENQGYSYASALVSNTGEPLLREKEARRLFGGFHPPANPSQITHVIMENQISTLASRMKTIQGELTMYFLIHYPNVHIEYVSSTHKLRHFAGVLPVRVPVPIPKKRCATTNEIVSSGPSVSPVSPVSLVHTLGQTVGAKYREHKQDAIQITTHLLEQNPAWSAQWQHTMSHKKKDDYADCFLQGLWYVSTLEAYTSLL